MSNCKAPNCDLKNFDQCNSSLTFCDIKGKESTVADSPATCITKSVGTLIFSRAPAECTVTASVNAQFECEGKIGCEWTYPTIIGTKVLEKKCVPKVANPGTGTKTYSCGHGTSAIDGSFRTDENQNRFSGKEKDTFGCPSDKCTYTPIKKERENGACTGGTTCSSHSKDTCLTTTATGCTWEPKDDAFCGYHRYFEEKITSEATVDKINDLNEEANDTYCKGITNPSESVCNHWGCIWDINGERDDSTINYDTDTSGICKFPNDENCMKNYCSQNTQPSTSGNRKEFHPDGICHKGTSDNCTSTGQEIIAHKTPGLMGITGHGSTQNTEISGVERIISNYETVVKATTVGASVKRDTLKKDIEELYKDSCEKRGTYPSVSDTERTFLKNKYDPSTKTCNTDIGTLCTTVKDNYNSKEYGAETTNVFYNDAKCLHNGTVVADTSTNQGAANVCLRLNTRADCEGSSGNCVWHDPKERCKFREITTSITTPTQLVPIKNDLTCRNNYYTLFSEFNTKIGEILVDINTAATAAGSAAEVTTYKVDTLYDYIYSGNHAKTDDVVVNLPLGVTYVSVTDEGCTSTINGVEVMKDVTNCVLDAGAGDADGSCALHSGADVDATCEYETTEDKIKKNIRRIIDDYGVQEQKNNLSHYFITLTTVTIPRLPDCTTGYTAGDAGNPSTTCPAGCTLTNAVDATCTGTDDGTGTACALNTAGDACNVVGGDCVFAAASDETCLNTDADCSSFTTGADPATCGSGCDYTAAVNASPETCTGTADDGSSTCDLDVSTDGTAVCPTGCTRTNAVAAVSESCEVTTPIVCNYAFNYNEHPGSGLDAIRLYTSDPTPHNEASNYKTFLEEAPIYPGEGTDSSWDWTSISTSHTSPTSNYTDYLDEKSHIEHEIKEIVYAPGKATIVLRSYSGDGIPVPYDKPSITTASDWPPRNIAFVNVDGTGGTSKYLELQKDYTITQEPKFYFNDFIEIEINGVDPGKVDDYTFTTPELKVNGTELRVEEIRFHDIEMDIYFESDIHNLYRKNDFINIELVKTGGVDTVFQKNMNTNFKLTGATAGTSDKSYNRVTEVDPFRNRIRVNNIVREFSGMYFPGRWIDKNAIKCFQFTSGGGVVVGPGEKCQHTKDLWKRCKDNTPPAASVCTDANASQAACVGAGCTFTAVGSTTAETGTCTTTPVGACAAATADQATCEAAGSCSFTDVGSTTVFEAATCTTTPVSACAAATADQATCEAAGSCTWNAGDSTCVVTDQDTECNRAATSQSDCDAAGALAGDCTYVPEVPAVPDTASCTVTNQDAACNAANADQATCEAAGTAAGDCTYTTVVNADPPSDSCVPSCGDGCELSDNGEQCLPKGYKNVDSITSSLFNYYSCNEIQQEYPDMNSKLERVWCANSSNEDKYESIFSSSNELTDSTSTNVYTITLTGSDFITDYFGVDIINEPGFSLDDWTIVYHNETDRTEGTIKLFITTKTQDTISSISFKVQKSDGTTFETGSIYPLNIYQDIKKGTGVTADKIKITNYIRKEVNTIPEITQPGTGITTQLEYFREVEDRNACEFNNGIWEEYTCRTHGADKRVRNIDVCENTGFNWNKGSQVCKKDITLDIDASTGRNYCDRKTTPTVSLGESSPSNPCPTCTFSTDRICKGKERKDCMKLSKTACITDKGCEYYVDRMEPPATGLKPQAKFSCKMKEGVTSDEATCAVETTKTACIGANCEWQCPFTKDSRDQSGYIVKKSIDETSDPTTTLDALTTSYYSPSDLKITCDEQGGWEPISTGEGSIRAECIENENSDPRTVSHTYRMNMVGCRPRITCGENMIDGSPLTGTILTAMDISRVPDEFKKGTGSSRTLDTTKLPNASGSYVCPASQTLLSNANDTVGWTDALCCHKTGLCQGNTVSSHDVQCPVGQIIKQIYYEGSSVLLPAQGTTAEQCCITPEEPTVTIPLDADYSQLAGSEGTTLRTTFEQNFKTDIVNILNAAENNISVTVTTNMIEILDISGGSIIVTFKIKKDTVGNIILKDQISRVITSGTTFPSVGAVSNGVPTYKAYDPKAKYLYWSDSLDMGITLEQLLLTIFVISMLLSSGFAAMGILFK